MPKKLQTVDHQRSIKTENTVLHIFIDLYNWIPTKLHLQLQACTVA